jgi:general secretion pathway protein K
MAIDWGRFVLQADLRLGQVDHHGELWATPVDETVLDETVTAGARLERLPRLRGRIVDAQGLFNLTNLVEAGAIAPQASAVHLAAFRRLLGFLDLPESLAELLVTRLLPTLGRVVEGTHIPPEQPRLLRLTDLREIRGFDEGAIRLLSDHAILLPARTQVNLNTATPEVLAAYLAIDPAQARQLISERGESFYKDINDAKARMRLGDEVDLGLFSVASDYFLVRGMVRFGRIENELMSLLHRTGNTVEVQWQYRL